MGRAQQHRISDAGQWAAAFPISYQGGAEVVLADALDDEAFRLGRLRQTDGQCAKPGDRGVGEAGAELVGAVERGMQRSQGIEAKGGEARSGQ